MSLNGLQDTQHSVRRSSLKTKSKDKFALFANANATDRILGWFLHLAITFRVGSLLFPATESQYS